MPLPPDIKATLDAVDWFQRYTEIIYGSLPPMPKRSFIWYCQGCGNLFYDVVQESCNCKSVWTAVELEMTSTTNCRIWWDASVLAYRMTSSFNHDLVDDIKQHIPVSERSYDPTTKVWTFTEKILQPLLSLFTMLQVKPVIITRQQYESQAAASQQSSTGSGAARGRPLDVVIIEFVRLLPYDAAKAAYRRAAIELHPDKNAGAADKMSTLNAAWDRISKEVYGQQ